MQLSVEEAKELYRQLIEAEANRVLWVARADELEADVARLEHAIGQRNAKVEALERQLTAANAEIKRLKELNRDLLLADSASSPLPAGVELKGSVVFVPTGEKRNPKTGEWFLNRTGAFVLADHDWGVGSTFAIYTRYDIPAQTEKEVQS